MAQVGGCEARDALGMDPFSTTPGGIALYVWGDVVRCFGQGPSQYGAGWNFPRGPTFTDNFQKLSHSWLRIERNPGEFPGNRKFPDSRRYDTQYLPIIAAFRKGFPVLLLLRAAKDGGHFRMVSIDLTAHHRNYIWTAGI